MDSSDSPVVSARDVIDTLINRPARWLGPAAVIAAVTLVVAPVRTRNWEAAQAMFVRDEVSIEANKAFNSTRGDDLKTAQETVAELAFGKDVLRDALNQVGPVSGKPTQSWPTEDDIEKLASSIQIVPPKGGEFGKTDIFYLKAVAPTQARAVAIADAVSLQVQFSFERLRRSKAETLIKELEKTVDRSRDDLNVATKRLTEMEQKIGGADLSELRILNEMPSGNSDLRNEATGLEAELRKERTAEQTERELLKMLKLAQVDPGELLASPQSLLESQPGIKRLKDGLLDAQLKTAALLGSMSPDHPLVIAARTAEQEIGEHLHRELAIAIRGVEADLSLSGERMASLLSQQQALRDRLDTLADVRASYGNLVAETKQRSEILKGAEMELASARAKQAAAHGGGLLQLIGEPVTGARPIGPGRTMIVLGGIAGGLLVGIGIVVLTTRPRGSEDFFARPILQTFGDREPAAHSAPRVAAVNKPRTPKPAPVSPPSPAVVSFEPATIALDDPNRLTFRQALEKVAGNKRKV